jgi:integrase/recombinase XerD
VKVKGNGRAKILTQAELERLFARGFLTPRDKLLFAIAYYCACRVSEVLALTAEDLAGSVVTLRKSTTKGKMATRTMPSHPKLQAYLAAYQWRQATHQSSCRSNPQSCLQASKD